jgi:hypothetical protein
MPSLTGMGIKVGGKIVEAALGKKAAKSAVAVSTKNAAKKAEAKAAVKAAAKNKPLANPKSAVRVKLPKKTIGNPPNLTRAEGRMIESVARAGGVKGPLGKKRDARVFTSKKPTGKSK